MRLVEKKCPNCGGELKFSFEDKETRCEYCGKSFEIERDEKIAEDKKEMFNAENYALTEETKKIAGGVARTIAVTQFVPILIIAIIFILIVCFWIFSFKHNSLISNNRNSSIQSKSEDDGKEKKSNKELMQGEGYVFSFDDLSENNLTIIHDNSKSILIENINRYSDFLYEYGEWSYVGMYLLTNDTGNSLYDIFSINFKIDGKSTTYYSGVKYDNVRVKDGKLVFNMNGFTVGTLNITSSSKSKDTFGFSNLKDLYNKVIRGVIYNSDLFTTGGVYKE